MIDKVRVIARYGKDGKIYGGGSDRYGEDSE